MSRSIEANKSVEENHGLCNGILKRSHKTEESSMEKTEDGQMLSELVLFVEEIWRRK